MFVGHLAVALGAKKVDSSLPLPLLIGASFGIDILWPILLLLGVETVVVDPGNTAFTALDFVSYPWSHSLLMVAVWAAFLGIISFRFGVSRSGSITVGTLVVSHWVLDWITHRPDLPLWPDGPLVGMGLWNSILGTYLVEGAMLAGGLYLLLNTIRLNSWKGKLALGSLVLLCVSIWASQPFSPPPPDSNAIAMVGLSMLLLPLWGYWIERTSTLVRSS